MTLQDLIDIMRLLNSAKWNTNPGTKAHDEVMQAMGKVDALGRNTAKLVQTTWKW